MKKDYNRIEAFVIYNGKRSLKYVAVNCDMKPIHTEYYWGGWSKSKYDEYGRKQIAYSSTGLSWKFEYNDEDKTLKITTETGYTYSVKYDE